MADAHAERDQHEREARRRNRVFLLPRHDLVVRIDVLLAQLRHLGSQLGDGHFRVTLHRSGARKHALRIDDERRLRERALLVFRGLVEIDGVVRAVVQHHLHRAFRLVEKQAAPLRQIGLGLRRRAALGDQDIGPAHSRRHLANVNDEIRELRVEHARLDLRFAARHEQLEGNLPECLICERQRDDHDVGRCRRRDEAEQQERTEEAANADAAGFHRHDLTIARQPAERDEDADEQGHRDGDAERLRHERRQHPNDDVPRRAFRNQRFAVLQNRRNFEREREQQQREPERSHELAQHITVENPQHSGSSAKISQGLAGRWVSATNHD